MVFVFLKLMALVSFNSRCPLTRDYKDSLAGPPPVPVEKGPQSREGGELLLITLLGLWHTLQNKRQKAREE